jgi:hypothetical protein
MFCLTRCNFYILNPSLTLPLKNKGRDYIIVKKDFTPFPLDLRGRAGDRV